MRERRRQWRRHRQQRWLRGVTFCERCGQVCDAACRRQAARDRHLVRATGYGLLR